jgi:hypothetical protein
MITPMCSPLASANASSFALIIGDTLARISDVTRLVVLGFFLLMVALSPGLIHIQALIAYRTPHGFANQIVFMIR